MYKYDFFCINMSEEKELLKEEKELLKELDKSRMFSDPNVTDIDLNFPTGFILLTIVQEKLKVKYVDDEDKKNDENNNKIVKEYERIKTCIKKSKNVKTK